MVHLNVRRQEAGAQMVGLVSTLMVAHLVRVLMRSIYLHGPVGLAALLADKVDQHPPVDSGPLAVAAVVVATAAMPLFLLGMAAVFLKRLPGMELQPSSRELLRELLGLAQQVLGEGLMANLFSWLNPTLTLISLDSPVGWAVAAAVQMVG